MMEQLFFSNTEEWKEARKGLFTASEIARLMEPGKRKMNEWELNTRPSKGEGSKTTTIEDNDLLSPGALTYIHEKAAEILAEGKFEFLNYEMQWGTEKEPEAVQEFCERMGLDRNSPEFLYCGNNDPVFYSMANIAGGSPDLVFKPAMGEVKCPNCTTHLQHLLATPESFRIDFKDKWTQCQSNMLFTETEVCYFISYDPRYKLKELQLKVIKIEADRDFQALILKKIELAKAKLDEIISQVYHLNNVAV